MIVKLIDAPCVGGRKAVALCDDEGKMIGLQQGAVVETRINEPATITVTFLIDGKDTRFE